MILDELYASEINFSVESDGDGIYVRLGNARNGYVAQAWVGTWAEAEAWLRTAAIEHCPTSDFAKNPEPWIIP